MLQTLVGKIDGKKTYIIAVVIAVLNLAVACGWVSVDHLAQINIVLGALGLGAVRASIANK